jgi:hypothetical protein
MAKAYSDEELATRTFLLAMAGIGAFIGAVFLFIL